MIALVHPDRVLAIDPGSRIAGYAVLADPDRPRIVEAGELRFSRGANRTKALAWRLSELYHEVIELADEHRPRWLAIEAVFVGANVRSSIALAKAQGVVLAAFGDDSGVVEYAPASIKKIVTGSGRADKESVRAVVRFQFPALADLGTSDVSDAIAIGLCRLAQLRTEALLARRS